MASLYRTYRPQTFADVVGQEHIVGTITKAIEQDAVTHAYLFQGPRGTGKTTLARLLAMRVNCEKPTGVEPCGTCSSCKALQLGSSLDIVEIDAASNRGIDDIRSLRETISTAPSGGKRKVYIIDEVHMLTNEAFAALLKTLEEPAKHVIFVLATTELHKVPDTIMSRCQVFRFRRASEEDMNKRLSFILKKEKRKVDDSVISFVVSRSDGCFRDAESLLGQILTMSEKDSSLQATIELLGLPDPKMVSSFITALEAGQAAEAVQIAQTAYEQGYDPELIIEESIRIARDSALVHAKKNEATGNLPVIIRALIQAKQDLSYIPQPLIALELAILTCTQSQGTRPATPSPTIRADVSQPKATPPTKPAPQPQTTTPTQNTPSKPSAGVENIQRAWAKIIDIIRGKNPAASTFLRAMEPLAIEGDQLTIRARFPLHRNFFEKPANKSALTEAITTATGNPVSIRISLDEQQGAPASTAPSSTQSAPQEQAAVQPNNSRNSKEAELRSNVQAVFGN